MANPTLWEKMAEMDEGRRELEAWKREQQRQSGRVPGFGVDEQCPRVEVDKWRHDDDQWHGGETVG